MIKIEKVLLFAIVLVFLVGVASATETPQEDQSYTNDDTVVSDISTVSQDNKETIKFEEKNLMDDNPIKIGESKTRSIEKKTKDTNLKQDGIIEVHNYTELQNAVNNARSTGVDTTIRLLQGSYNNTGTITWITGGMVLTIDGNGQIINGQQQQVFYIYGASLVLKNIIITNATSSNGGAIFNYMSTLTVSNSTFNNNQATREGGAIHNLEGTLTVSNSTFNNNQADYGGAILNQGDITVTNSRLINNHATSDGGAIYNYGILPVIGSTLENNTAGQRGGAIHNAYIANITVSNSSLNNNNATNGGAISLHCGWSSEFAFCNVTNSNFTQNHASNGAVIYTTNEYVDINVTDTLFARNTADNKETLYINGTKKVNDNTYDFTDILLNKINLAVKDNKNSYTTLEGIVLNFTIELANPSNYDEDILEKLEDITLYINGQKNITTKYENYTLSGLEHGEYEVYYTTCNQQSNKVTFKVIGDAEVNVTNYTQLVQAIENATNNPYTSYKINLQPGDYNATTSINWENSATKKIIINGNNNTLNGQHTHRFIKINSGHNLTLENITITNYTSGYGGAIYNYYGYLTITNSKFTNNQATDEGGAIYNYVGTLTVSNSTFNNNQATVDGGDGGAIFDYSRDILTNISSCNFINNTALQGAAIYAYGWVNLTNNTFKENTATNNNETIDLYSYWNGLFEGNTYESTDIALNEIKLTIKDDQETFQQDEDIILNYTIQLTNPMYYWDFETGINDITLYINGEKNKTTQYENTTLKDLPAGKYEIYYTTCNQKSNTVTFKVIGDSQITTPEVSYEYYEGINTKIPLIITDPSGEKGTINITVKEDNEYKQLFTYYNIGDGYELPTESLASALKNLYNPLSDSYTINVTYSSDCTNPSSTEFTLNINKQRNTTIAYDILNNTQGNVQINITVLDQVYNTPVNDATISITGDITESITAGVITDNTLTAGDHTIKVQYQETDEYKASEATIDFTVEIDKDKKIRELEEEISNLTTKLEEAQQTITALNNNITNLTQQLTEANNQITTLNNTINDLNNQLNEANKEKETLNKNITNLTQQLTDANNQINKLNNNINNLTEQLTEANKEITTLNNTINDLNNQLDDANKEIESLNIDINNLTQQLEDSNNKINNLNEELGQANKEIETLSNNNKELTDKLEEANKEIEKLNNIIKELTKPPLNTTITINPIKSSIGSITKLTANIMDENKQPVTGGKAVFKINGITLKDENNNTLYASVNNGIASINYKVQDVWIKDTSYVEAVYGGTAKYAQSRTKATDVLDISQGIAMITLEEQTVTAKSGETVTFRAKVVDATGDKINKGKVVFKLNGKTLKDENGETLYAQVKDGQATLDYTIPSIYSAKAYTLTAVFGGGNYQRAETTGKLILEKQAVTISTDRITTTNGKTSIKAKIRDETGKLLVTSTKIAIKINQKTILNNVTSTNGTIDVSFTTTLRPGIYELTIISGENSIYKKGTLNTVLNI